MAINITKGNSNYESPNWRDKVDVLNKGNLQPITDNLEDISEKAKNSIVTVLVAMDSWEDLGDGLYGVTINHDFNTLSIKTDAFASEDTKLVEMSISTEINSSTQIVVKSDEKFVGRIILVADIL